MNRIKHFGALLKLYNYPHKIYNNNMENKVKDKTKDRVYELVCDYTVKFSMSKVLVGSAVSIAETLYVSRSLVSLYLNELYKEGLLIKINSRPVYFLDKKTLSKTLKIYIHQSSFDYVEDLLDLIDTKLFNKGSFIGAIGHDGSLNYCIHQMQSAVKYPGKGLPILLSGNVGTGKTFLADLLARFCVNEGIIEDNIIIYSMDKNCDGRTLRDKLFGYYSRNESKCVRGLIEKCKKGMLILENVQRCDEDAMTALIHYFKNGYYTMRGSDEKYSSSARIVLTCIPNVLTENWLEKELPIVCRIPDFHERPVKERESAIIEYFLQEQKVVDKKISISKKVFYCLSEHIYSSNFKELQAVIKSLCITSYNEDEETLHVRMYQLPHEILEDGMKYQGSYGDSDILIDDLHVEYPKNPMLVYFDVLLSLYGKVTEGNESDEQRFMSECRDRMNDYYDYLTYDYSVQNSRISAYESAIRKIADIFLEQYQILLAAACVRVLAKMIYNMACNYVSIQEWKNQNLDRVTALKGYFKKNYCRSYYYAEIFADKIKVMLDIDIDQIDEMFIFLNIYFNNIQLDEIKYNCLIAAHGYSTASSIADSVNRMVEMNIFSGIDMPIGITFHEVIIAIRKYMKRIGNNKDIIILIDMGSLEEMDRTLLGVKGANIGIINNVNNKLALNVAIKVKQGLELEEIIETCARENICEYKLQIVPKNEAAIVFTNEAGEVATERVIQLLKESLPKTVGLSIIPYSYENLLLQKDKAAIFDTHHVVLLVGLSEIEGLNVPFISLEDIVAFRDFKLITRVLRQYMDEEEISILNDNLIKKFSLTSILDNITILNAAKLYDELQDSFSIIENNYNMMIPNKTKVGLYIHFSCLIERLVLGQESALNDKKPDMNNKDLERFVRTANFSFKKINSFYKISIPNNEIYYLYEHLETILRA